MGPFAATSGGGRSEVERESVGELAFAIVFFVPLLGYLLALALLSWRARYPTSESAPSPFLYVSLVISHPLAMCMVSAAYAYLSLFGPEGRTWISVGWLSQKTLGLALFFAPLLALIQAVLVRKMGAFLLVCALGTAWAIFVVFFSENHDLELVRGSIIRW